VREKKGKMQKKKMDAPKLKRSKKRKFRNKQTPLDKVIEVPEQVPEWMPSTRSGLKRKFEHEVIELKKPAIVKKKTKSVILKNKNKK
jgi:hypothetical protein